MPRPRSDTIGRKKFSTILTEDIIWDLKRQAAEERRDMFLVVEDAIKTYLKAKRGSRHKG